MVEKETSKNSSVGHYRNQCYAVFAANLIVFSQGCIFGWITPILPLWMSDDTPLSTGPMTTEEISWVVAIGSLGSLFSAFFFRSIINWLGCKRMLTSFLAIISIITWLLFAFGRTKYEIMIARFIAGGMGGGIEGSVLLFVSEIADNRIRGALGSVFGFVRVTGNLVSLIVATYVDYSMIAFIFVGVPVLFIAMFLWLPNTPTYLIRAGKHEEAKKSICFYKGLTQGSVDSVDALNKEYERLVAIAAHHTSKSESISLQNLRKPAVYKGLLIGIVLTLLNQSCGAFVLSVYSVGIFQEAKTSIDPYIQSIILGALQLVGTFSSTSLVDILGRKLLLIISMAGCTVGLSAMATYMYLSSLGYDLTMVDWIPVVSLGFVIFISSVGIGSLIFLCIVESLPTEARSFGLAVSFVSLNIFSFLSSKLFPVLSQSLHLHGVLSLYAAVSGFGTFLVAVIIKETKGKNLEDVGGKEHS